MELIFGVIMAIVSITFLRNVIFGTMLKLIKTEKPKLPDELPMVSIVVPCFNEPVGIRLTLQSLAKIDYPKHLYEVIVVDDKSKDNSTDVVEQCIYELNGTNIKLVRQPTNQGKTAALIAGTRASIGSIICTFDSDVIVWPEVIKSFVAELQDPDVGLVGASCGVYNTNNNVITQGYTSVFYSLHEWLKQIESRIGLVGVVDGKGVGARRDVYEMAFPYVEHRTWLGLTMHAGEDRHLTHIICLKGYKTKMVKERIATSAPETLLELYKQQIRWRRSGLRDWLFTIKTLPMHCFKLGIMKTFSLLLSRTMYALIPLVHVAIAYQWGIMGVLDSIIGFMSIVLVLKCILNVHAYFTQSDQVLDNPLITSVALSSWFFIDLTITTTLSLLTLDEGGWGTRDLSSTSEKVKNG